MHDLHFDFEAVLVLATLIAAICWVAERFFRAPRRRPDQRPNWFLEFGYSLFPVLLVVLVLRSFVVEPFRIPSPSMAPTLLPGDFILVNKFAYGLRLPVIHTEVLDLGAPERGDIAVFRWPVDTGQDFIKRIVGLPGDVVMYKNHQIYVNGEKVPAEKLGLYAGEGVPERQRILAYREQLGEHDHRILKVDGISQRRRLMEYMSYWMGQMEPAQRARLNVSVSEDGAVRWRVPEHAYFVMGDNRDHSLDSRFWGFVPESNLVGPAFLIWMSIDYEPLGLRFSRFGEVLE